MGPGGSSGRAIEEGKTTWQRTRVVAVAAVVVRQRPAVRSLSTAAPKGFRQKISQMIAGIQAVIPDGSSVAVGGVTVAKADLVNELMQISSAYQAIDAGVLAAKAARSQLNGQLPGFRKQYVGIKDAIVGVLGPGEPAVGAVRDHGFDGIRSR